MTRPRTLITAALAPLVASAILSGVVVRGIASKDMTDFVDPATGHLDLAYTAQIWALFAVYALPIGFVVGAICVAVIRAMRRGQMHDWKCER